jgi:hypothetical protein
MNGAKATVFDDPYFSVAAVRDPEAPLVEPRGMGTGQAADDGLARAAGENDPAAVDGEVAMPGLSRRDLVRRCREERFGEISAGGDGVELDVVSFRECPPRSFDAARPPGRAQSTRRLDADHDVLPHRVRVEDASDERQVVEVRAPGVVTPAHGDQRAGARGRRELENLVRVSRGGEVQDPALSIVDQARGVGETKVRRERMPVFDTESDDQVLVFAAHEESRLEAVENVPEIAARAKAEKRGVELSRFLPEARDLAGVSPLGVVPRPRRFPRFHRLSRARERHMEKAPQ